MCAYGGIGVIACGYWYLTNRKPRRQPNRATLQKELRDRERERARAVQKEKENKPKKIKSGGESSGNETQRRSRTKMEAKHTEPFFATTQDNTKDNDVDDKEFARQLSSVKSGTSMAPKQELGSRQKSVKLSKAATSEDDNTAGWANGEHVSDGDDDLSSAASPELNATVLKAGDVSDMLGNTTAAGPSILRLTEPTNPKPVRAKKDVKPKEPELTKKQRQNQAKREAEKIQRAEEEKVRRAKEELQRKVAREAEGRAAKDGSSTLYSSAPKTSAWNNTSKDASTQPSNVQLLETYAPDVPHAGAGPNASQTTLRAAEAPAPPIHYSDLPSEEEQMRLLSENDESGWREVTSKKSKSKLPRAAEVVGSGKHTCISRTLYASLT